MYPAAAWNKSKFGETYNSPNGDYSPESGVVMGSRRSSRAMRVESHAFIADRTLNVTFELPGNVCLENA